MEIILCTLGLSSIVTGIIYYQKGGKLFHNGKRVQAEIIDLTQKSSNLGSSIGQGLYYPVIRFRTPDGQTIRKELNFGSNPSYYSIGQQVTAIYDPDKPENCGIHSKFQLLGIPAIIIAMGVICITIAAALYLEVF
jgi:hypothetical protein